MSRLSPRVKVVIPVTIGPEQTDSSMTITDIGMNGAFVKIDLSVAHGKLGLTETIVLDYYLGSKEHLVCKGKMVRQNSEGYAIDFSKFDYMTRKKIWEFISGRIYVNDQCPFCGNKIESRQQACDKCGWKLNFKAAEYFDYYEKKHLVKRVNLLIQDIDTTELYKVYDFFGSIVSRSLSRPVLEHDEEFIGTCEQMLEVFSQINKVAATDISIVLLGESGTGKEMTARAIHERSLRKEGRFVAINCSAIPENLLESELFGYEKGAFTGATASKMGKFEYAHGGTILLDEIGEMPLLLQVKLLRFLQDRKVERIGSLSSRKVDVRVIAATNCDLAALVSEGKFRKDLYYRLGEFTITLPPVRERGEDKVTLANFFLKKACEKRETIKTFSSEAVEAIMSYDWPGNVREIINKVRRAVVMGNSIEISAYDMDLDPLNTQHKKVARPSDVLVQLEKCRVQDALDSCNNNISAAAILLGITRQTLHRRLKLLGLRHSS